MVWLELNKIRHLAPEQRQPLRDTASQQWPYALTQYLTQLFPSPSQSPLATSQSSVVVADALLRHAIAVEYTDRAEEYNSRAKQHKPSHSASASSAAQQRTNKQQQLPAYSDADIRAGLTALTAQLALPSPDSFQPLLPTSHLLTSLTSLLSLHIALPPVEPTSTDALSFVRQLPMSAAERAAVAGMDERVVLLAGVLQLLSVWRLREVQERVTECLHAVQQQVRAGGKRTGRVDMKKGEVGR